MRSVKFLFAAGAASLLSSAAFAADMPSIMPAPQPYYAPPAQDFGGWYLRGDIGMTNSSGKLDDNLFHTLPAGSTLTHQGEGFTGGTSYGLGVGYQFNSWFRADITGEYRSRVAFSGTDFATFQGGSALSDVYQGGYTSWVGLVNAYIDLGTWWCLTPFIGAGVGVAHISTTGLQDSGLVFAPGLGSAAPLHSSPMALRPPTSHGPPMPVSPTRSPTTSRSNWRIAISTWVPRCTASAARSTAAMPARLPSSSAT